MGDIFSIDHAMIYLGAQVTIDNFLGVRWNEVWEKISE
jgi:hypothetical protein